MRSRTFIIIALTAVISFAAPKQRAWEDGRILDNRDNPYFKGEEVTAIDGTKPITYTTNDQFNVTQNSGSRTVYDHYVIEGRSAGYLVEFAHLKSYPGAHVTVKKPLKFAVQKSKLWFLDERGQEYETEIIKTVPRPGAALVTQVQTPAPAPAPAPPAPKPTPKPAPAVAKEEAPAVVLAKVEAKETPVVVKQPQKQEPPVKPAPDRPWQGGQLLSTASNRFFANIAYVTETDASTWSFVLGSDGKFTAFIHAAATGASSFVYDNYVIETEFCGYLVQRTRAKNVPPARFPGTKPLKFAIEKTKIWIIDEEGKEYEAKIVKQIQKDPEGEAQTPVRTAVR